MMVNGSSMVDTTVGEAKKALERALRDHRVSLDLYNRVSCPQV